MRLTDLQIDGFGVLAGVQLEELAPGLNVVHGPNGCGKTTLMQFLRGMWTGFDEARRRRFLPPLAGGTPGGSIGLAGGERSFRVTRQALPNNSDRLAIAVRRGGADDGSVLRAVLEALSPELVELLYTAAAPDPPALERLLQVAARDGVALLGQRKPSRRLEERLTDVRRRRTILLGGEGAGGETQRLRDACQQSAEELAALQREAERLREELATRFGELLAQIDRLAERVEWLDLERQAVETDLAEAEAAAAPIPAAPREVVVVASSAQEELAQQAADLDRRIAQARNVLADVAQERMQVSTRQAESAGLTLADVGETLQHQRRLLGALEQHLLALRQTADSVPPDDHARGIEFAAQARQAVRELQQRLYQLCQQMARLEQAHRQWVCAAERSRLDQCEADVVEHLTRLQRERSRLLAAAPAWAALEHSSRQESLACQCREHHRFAAPPGSAVEVRTAPAPAADPRPIDPRLDAWRERRQLLTTQWEQARQAWREARSLQAEWELERSRLVVLERGIAEQQVEVEHRERQLAARLVEGQALLVVEAGLLKMRSTLLEDEPAPVIVEASAWLRELTAGRYPALWVAAETRELSALNDSGVAIPLTALSRGTLDQVGLSLRLALAEEYARRGVSLPLVMDEVLADSDPDRLDVAIRVLQRVAQRRQILYLTCQEHLAARFEAAGTPVRAFPGTRRTARSVPVARPAAAAPEAGDAPPPLGQAAAAETLPPPTDSTAPEEAPGVESLPTAAATETGVDLALLAGAAPESLHPSEPHWLRVTSPVSVIPSVGEQMARRLAAAGVRTVQDLVELDCEEAQRPLSSLQITPARWRIWQAEGRLLCCVPHLTGRDAQLLVAVGLLVPQELAQEDADELVRKIDRLRGDGRSGWTVAGFVWPDRRTVARWIAWGRQARTWREACEASDHHARSVRKSAADPEAAPSDSGSAGGDHRRRLRIDQPSSFRGPRQRRRFGQRGRAGRLWASSAEREQTAGATTPAPVWETAEGPASASISTAPVSISTAPASISAGEVAPARLRFFLELSSRIVEAPSIGPTTARRLEKIGILTVADLLNRDAQQIADRLQHRRLPAEAVRQWQDQARLMCRIPELRGHDAQVLTACGLTDPEAIARMSPQALFAIVGPFVATKEGQRLLRSAKSPDLEEVARWITWAQQARTLKAA